MAIRATVAACNFQEHFPKPRLARIRRANSMKQINKPAGENWKKIDDTQDRLTRSAKLDRECVRSAKERDALATLRRDFFVVKLKRVSPL